MHIAPFVIEHSITPFQSKHCAYISNENSKVRVHRNMKTILLYFKVILPWEKKW
jgi:hypothetical protein